MTASPKTRFAPSPTGHLHLGHAASAFHVWRAAEGLGAQVLLRIEDIDHTRCRPQFEDSILEDLEWLGLDWPTPFRRQSEHLAGYAGVLSALRKRGLVYRCFRTRSEIAEITDNPESYVGMPLPEDEELQRLAAGEPFAWRLSVAAARAALGADGETLAYRECVDGDIREVAVDPARFGDVVLARKDIATSYHIACCHDDWTQGITHVIRGEDLREVTHVHIVLQALMDWPHPIYAFHRLLFGADGEKLSKRNQDKSLRAYRAEGVTVAEIRRMTGFHD